MPMMAELALFISPISVILTICTLVFHRKKGTVGFAAAAFIFNLLGAAFFPISYSQPCMERRG